MSCLSFGMVLSVCTVGAINVVTLPSRLVSSNVVYYYYYYYCYHAVHEKRELAKLEMEGQAPQATRCLAFNPLTPNDLYRGRTAPLTYKVPFYIFIQQI